MKKVNDNSIGSRKLNQSGVPEGPLAVEDEPTKKIRRNNVVGIIKKICNLKISNEFNG